MTDRDRLKAQRAEIAARIRALQAESRNLDEQLRWEKQATRLPRFELQFDTAELPYWAARYDAAGDDDALAAGKRIAAGDYSRRNLKVIFKWKTKNRGVSRIERNDDADISRALHEACHADDDRNAVEALKRLSGVDVPVASAILTVIYPERYTVIDFRALGSLGVEKKTPSVSFYLAYLRYCREAAAKFGTRLRDFDRSLWQRHYELSRSSCEGTVDRIGSDLATFPSSSRRTTA